MNYTTKNALGSYCLYRQKLDKGRWSDKWAAEITFEGRRQKRGTGVDICASCARASLMPGKSRAEQEARQAEYDRCKVKFGCRQLARQRCDGMLLQMTTELFEGRKADPTKPVKIATIGEIIATYREHYRLAIASEKAARRNTTDLLLVLAYALDKWQTIEARPQVYKRAFKVPRTGRVSTGIKGKAPGSIVPDVEALMSLPASVLNGDTAKAYFINRCAKLDVPCSWATADPREEYTTINSTMRHTRDLFRAKPMAHIYKGRLELPKLEAWMEYPLLPEIDAEPEPITGATFDALVAGGEALRESDPDLWLCARVMRQTGMRCGSAVHLQGSWVRRHYAGWLLDVNRGKSGTAKYSVPISAETAEAILERGQGFTFGDDEAGRGALVNRRHNDFLKLIAGAPERGHQGAHRLRDTLAGALYGLLGPEGAKSALAHEDIRTTFAHYARRPFECSEVMRHEFAAFLNQSAASAQVRSLEPIL